MKVADIMTRGVISLAPGDTMRKAAQLMLQYDVSGFPVLDRGRLVGRPISNRPMGQAALANGIGHRARDELP